MLILQCPYGYIQRHSFPYPANLRFINVPAKDHVIHIGYRSNAGPGVEGVCLYYGIPHFYRYVEDHTRDGGPDLRIAGGRRTFGYAVTDDLEVVLGIAKFLTGQFQLGFHFFIFLPYNDLGIVQLAGAVIHPLGLLQVQIGLRHPGFGGIEGPHFRDHLDPCYDFTHTYHLSGFLVQIRYDTRYLGHYGHLVPGLHLPRCNGFLFNIPVRGNNQFVNLFLGP